MTESPSVTVVVPAFNAERFLDRAVRSIFATGYPSLDVAIVDDGSQDATVAAAQRLCEEFRPRCRLLRHSDSGNHGVSASRNLGIAASVSEWVAFLDADDFYLPNRFQSLLRHVEQGIAGDAIYDICEVQSDGSDASAAGLPMAVDALFGLRQPLTGDALLAELLKGYCWAISAITLRRDLLHRTGLFDIEKQIAEDCDLWFRVAAIGNVVPGNIAQPVSVYWRHENNTYRYGLGHRIAMLQAMLDAGSWARKNTSSPELKLMFKVQARKYATRSIVAAREANETRIAFSLLRYMAIHGDLGYFMDAGVLRQFAALVRDCIGGRAGVQRQKA